jgi:hypothetical protein
MESKLFGIAARRLTQIIRIKDLFLNMEMMSCETSILSSLTRLGPDPLHFDPSRSPSSPMEHAVNLSEHRLATLKADMGYLSEMNRWQIRVEKAATVDSEWRSLLSEVFVCITKELADTDIVIASPSGQQASDIVAQLNQDELEEWKTAVQSGVEKGDWTDLIEHRMYFLVYRTVGSHLIIIAARLKKPLQLNASLGVPIEKRMFYYFLSPPI